MVKSPLFRSLGARSLAREDIRSLATPGVGKKWNTMSEQPEWWEEFFPVWAEVQRQAKSEEQTRSEADCIENLLQLPLQAKVLDVPCGEGRLALQLAALGFRVTGVDLALPLLEEARQKAAERRLEAAWEHRDMRDLPWQAIFDGAFCFWGSFGYFDEAGNAAFLQ